MGIRAVWVGSREEGDGPAGTVGSQARPSVSVGLVSLHLLGAPAALNIKLTMIKRRKAYKS